MDLTGKQIIIIATNYFGESELVQPMTELRDMGAKVVVAAPERGLLQSLRHVEPGRQVEATQAIRDIDAGEYDALVIPGGVVNADHLRVDPDAQELLRDMMDAGKPVAIICHGPWLLVSSRLTVGRTITSYHTLKDDITNAGGNWVDQEVVVDKNLITSRKPDDLPAFIRSIATALAG